MGAKQMKHIREFSLFESKINAIRVEIPYETYEKDSNGHYTKNRIKGKSKIIDYADRKIVLFDINGIRIPFYLSSGHAGKKDVAAGKWYPFFGIGSDYWFNKGHQSDINKYYEIGILKSIAQSLDSNIGDIRNDKTIPKVAPNGIHLDTINRDLTPTEHGMSYTVNKFYDSVKRIKEKLESLNENASFNTLYHQIDNNEFGSMVKDVNALERFGSEIDQIEKVLKKDWSKLIIHSSYKIEIRTKIGSDIVGFYMIFFRIFKLNDEWFLVERENITKNTKLYYKCDQFDGLIELLEDEGVVDLRIRESAMSPDEVEDYFIEFLDDGDINIVESEQDELHRQWRGRSNIYLDYLYINSVKINKFDSHQKKIESPTINTSKENVTYLKIEILQPKWRAKGNLDIRGYTIDTMDYLFRKFARHINCNILIKIMDQDLFGDILSKSIVRIEFLN
jgi:hypothetical protein